MSDPESKKRFFQLADLAFTWFVIDKNGVSHIFKSEKEALEFMEANNIAIPKERGCKNAISSEGNNDIQSK